MYPNAPTIRCYSCGYLGPVLTAHTGYPWWIYLLAVVLCFSGLGVLPIAIILILLGRRTFPACPDCKGRQLGPWEGLPSQVSLEIWQQAQSADDRAYQRSRLLARSIVAAGALLIIAVAATIVYLTIQGRI